MPSLQGETGPIRGASGTHDRYTLLEPLGRGASGVVYAAHDRALDRRVAIKLLRSRADSRARADVEDRLLAEARVLARLAHPNVVHVYDVASYGPGELVPTLPDLAETDELPAEKGVLIVMEMVEGDPLTEWLEGGARPWREALDVLIPAGRGLAAAHGCGLVHRDFKPSNVLLGDDGRARVVDFGLARESIVAQLRGPRRNDVGTPAYMAPEQHRGDAATAATDQFAFCMVLYEALCGRRPWTAQEIRELARGDPSEAVAPPRPRVQLPRRLWTALRRGLALVPARRFASMDGLLDELDRVARVPTRTIAVALVGVVITATVGVVALGAAGRLGTTCGDGRRELAGIWDERAREHLRAAFAVTGKPYAEAIGHSTAGGLEAYAQSWTDARSRTCASDEPPEIASWRAGCLDAARTALADTVEELQRANHGVVEHALDVVGALPSIDECMVADPPEAMLAQLADARERRASLDRELVRARLLLTAARYDEAGDVIRSVLEQARDGGLPDVEARAMLELGRARVGDGDAAEAEAHLRAAVAIAEAAEDDETVTRAQTLQVHLIGVHLGRLAEADRMIELLRARVSGRGEDGELAAEFHRTLGALRERQGRFAEALDAFERTLAIRSRLFPADDPAVAQALGAVGLAQFRLGRYALARDSFTRSVSAYRKSLGDDHPRVGTGLGRIATAASEAGDLATAIALQRESVAVLERALGPTHVEVADAVGNLALLHHRAGEEEEALSQGQHALEIERAVRGREHPQYGLTLGNHALVLRALGRREQAIEALREQLAIYERAYEPGHVDLGFPHVNLASVLLQLGRLQEAREHATAALAIWEQSLGPQHDYVATALSNLCMIDIELGEIERGRELCRRGLALYDSLAEHEEPELLGDLAFGLARAVEGSSPAEARTLAQRAWTAFDGANEHDARLQLERWMLERDIPLPPTPREPRPG